MLAVIQALKMNQNSSSSTSGNADFSVTLPIVVVQLCFSYVPRQVALNVSHSLVGLVCFLKRFYVVPQSDSSIHRALLRQ